VIRVYPHPDFADEDASVLQGVRAPFEDFDASSAAVATDGSLVLAVVEFREVRDPGNLAAPPRMERSEAQMVSIIANGLWGRADNMGESDAT
jgi:hypothetical protein